MHARTHTQSRTHALTRTHTHTTGGLSSGGLEPAWARHERRVCQPTSCLSLSHWSRSQGQRPLSDLSPNYFDSKESTGCRYCSEGNRNHTEVGLLELGHNSVAGELCKLARVTSPEFPHPFSPVGRCLPATGRCRAVRYKRQYLPGFCSGGSGGR